MKNTLYGIVKGIKSTQLLAHLKVLNGLSIVAYLGSGLVWYNDLIF
ncbi:hypothetical protein SAMN05421821_11971 [Mucilaginibacter lappiensis]|uniref:Uncharacterized protein n=1 Tax=Mucilaginibacter lappiensis TaxID=354630 RepID=A0A1N7FRF0_9SPHI|nr:hypothetical protein [Mucilaginibacter lappiensis]MBB6129227.1 hypothetical protein [Mucilaginibacter lappiensis]SIS02825.1 hypothetical protein SAMN05421821_11971 [Mucilaginibacter lappiensis]